MHFVQGSEAKLEEKREHREYLNHIYCADVAMTSFLDILCVRSWVQGSLVDLF